MFVGAAATGVSRELGLESPPCASAGVAPAEAEVAAGVGAAMAAARTVRVVAHESAEHFVAAPGLALLRAFVAEPRRGAVFDAARALALQATAESSTHTHTLAWR